MSERTQADGQLYAYYSLLNLIWMQKLHLAMITMHGRSAISAFMCGWVGWAPADFKKCTATLLRDPSADNVTHIAHTQILQQPSIETEPSLDCRQAMSLLSFNTRTGHIAGRIACLAASKIVLLVLQALAI